jgi:hypothetical protein
MNELFSLCLCLLVYAVPAGAMPADSDQVVNPADQQADKQKEGKPSQGDDHQHTYEMPPVDVYGRAPLSEDDRIGDYAQPRWTADRLFSETRVYVIPKGKVEFEYWTVPETLRAGSTDLATMYEAEFGLPGRFQIDLYAVSHKDGLSGPMSFSEQKAELRYAFADWGRIWGNPTVYVEYTSLNNAYDHFEGKLLLGGTIASGWHWGSNFVWEHELGGPQENSNEWTVGVSRTVRDRRFDVGVETKFALVNAIEADGRRGPFSTEFLAGPSVQIRPLPRMHIDVAPLVGFTHDASRSKIFVVLGYEF